MSDYATPAKDRGVCRGCAGLIHYSRLGDVSGWLHDDSLSNACPQEARAAEMHRLQKERSEAVKFMHCPDYMREDLRVFVVHDDASRVMDEPWASRIDEYRKQKQGQR